MVSNICISALAFNLQLYLASLKFFCPFLTPRGDFSWCQKSQHFPLVQPLGVAGCVCRLESSIQTTTHPPTHTSMFNHSIDFHPWLILYNTWVHSYHCLYNLIRAMLIILMGKNPSAPSFKIKCLWLSSGWQFALEVNRPTVANLDTFSLGRVNQEQ